MTDLAFHQGTFVWFSLVDYDEASLPFADGEPVYVIDARTVCFDEKAGPCCGHIVVPPLPLHKDGEAIALVCMQQGPDAFLEMGYDGLVSISRVDRAVRR